MKKDYKGMATTIGAIIVLLLILIFAFIRSENKFEGTVIGTTNNANGKLEFIYVEDEDEIMKFIFDENTKNELGEIKCFDEVIIKYDEDSFESATYNDKAICSYIIENIK